MEIAYLGQGPLVVEAGDLELWWRRGLHGRVVRVGHVGRCKGGRGVGGLDGDPRHHLLLLAVGVGGRLDGAHGRGRVKVVVLGELGRGLCRRRVVAVEGGVRGHGWCWRESRTAGLLRVVVVR